MTDSQNNVLWNPIRDGGFYQDSEKWHLHLLEQYKVYVEMADRISQRRVSANNYFSSINSAILAFAGYLAVGSDPGQMWLLAIAGCVLTLFWYNIVVSYRNLNAAKWLVVQNIERRLPSSPYRAEWEVLKEGNSPHLYRPISHIESWVPWVFFTLHGIVFFRSFPWITVVS